jgi:homocysteine S-methyltransferase
VNCVPAAAAGPWVEALGAVGVPWGVYANAGAPEEGMRHGTPGAGPRYGSVARTWVERGARVVGGCCGTGPASIAAVAILTDLRQGVDGRSDDS